MPFKIKDSVDVYLIPGSDGLAKLQFYKINTREKLTVEVSDEVPVVLSLLDGKRTLKEISKDEGVALNLEEALEFFSFLEERGFCVQVEEGDQLCLGAVELDRYSRQLNFFSDYLSIRGDKAQKCLRDSHVVIFGAGGVGGSIAIQLARAGVGKFTIIDPKDVVEKNLERHEFVCMKDVGKAKVRALKEYLEKINTNIAVVPVKKSLYPKAELGEYYSGHVDLVVNTADEPYIGYTTLKLGRMLWEKNVALYSAGGFDAHLMCTGEFIIPGVTPCADCYSSYFSQALKDWKPSYMERTILGMEGAAVGGDDSNKLGAGGVASQISFSASFACIQILRYLVDKGGENIKYSARGEYMANKGVMTWVEMARNKDCMLCGGSA